MISIMMQSRNNKSNALESVFGIFLHSTNTPEKVIQALAHMGISISLRVSNDSSNNNIHRHTSAVEAGASKVAGLQTTRILDGYVLSVAPTMFVVHGWQLGMPKNEGKCFYLNRNTVGGASFIIIRKLSASFSLPDL
jgi:hypothetical protein